MKLLIKVPTNKKAVVEEKLKSDDKISRASIVIKDGTVFGKAGTYYFLIDGDEEVIEKVKQIPEIEEVKGEEEREILSKIEEEENKALEGFGSILG